MFVANENNAVAPTNPADVAGDIFNTENIEQILQNHALPYNSESIHSGSEVSNTTIRAPSVLDEVLLDQVFQSTYAHAQNNALNASPIYESPDWFGFNSSLRSLNDATPSRSPQEQSHIPDDLFDIGYSDDHGNWRCKYAGCTVKRIFTRACDLRKHWTRHRRDHVCSKPGCGMRFSTAKDLRRHHASHDPGVHCLARKCSRVFSRVDNMMDHHRRIHQKNPSHQLGLSFRRRRVNKKPQK